MSKPRGYMKVYLTVTGDPRSKEHELFVKLLKRTLYTENIQVRTSQEDTNITITLFPRNMTKFVGDLTNIKTSSKIHNENIWSISTYVDQSNIVWPWVLLPDYSLGDADDLNPLVREGASSINVISEKVLRSSKLVTKRYNYLVMGEPASVDLVLRKHVYFNEFNDNSIYLDTIWHPLKNSRSVSILCACSNGIVSFVNPDLIVSKRIIKELMQTDMIAGLVKHPYKVFTDQPRKFKTI